MSGQGQPDWKSVRLVRVHDWLPISAAALVTGAMALLLASVLTQGGDTAADLPDAIAERYAPLVAEKAISQQDYTNAVAAQKAAEADVAAFCQKHSRWVVEGCYADLVEAVLELRPLLVFLNPGLESCTANCLSRPWESHKYPSKQEQDANLQFLLSWVAEYYTRDGPMSLAAHRSLFRDHPGRKVEFHHVPRLNPPESDVLALLRAP